MSLEKTPTENVSRDSRRVEKDLSGTVGARLQALRKKFGLSQRELARRADVTNSTLSMIEQGKVSPSVGSLEKILLAFPLSLQEFFSESIELSPPVISSNDFVKVEHEQVAVKMLPAFLGNRKQHAQLSEYCFPPGTRIHSEWIINKGFVAGIVVEGSLDIYLEGAQFHAEAGDGFNFSSQREHSLINSGDGICRIVSVVFAD